MGKCLCKCYKQFPKSFIEQVGIVTELIILNVGSLYKLNLYKLNLNKLNLYKLNFRFFLFISLLPEITLSKTFRGSARLFESPELYSSFDALCGRNEAPLSKGKTETNKNLARKY